MPRSKTEQPTTPEQVKTLIEAEESRIESLVAQKMDIERKIKDGRAKVAALNERLNQTKILEITSLAAKKGVTLDQLLSAAQDGTIFSLITDGKDENGSTNSTDKDLSNPEDETEDNRVGEQNEFLSETSDEASVFFNEVNEG